MPCVDVNDDACTGGRVSASACCVGVGVRRAMRCEEEEEDPGTDVRDKGVCE